MVSDYEKHRLDEELKSFVSRNFIRPNYCNNLDQIRFYVRELCKKIEEYQARFDYVPQHAYVILNQYNMAQNRLIQQEFTKSYS